MGKKYIIDLNPDCVEGEYLLIPARIAGEQQWLMTKAALTPCTELDLEQVRKEAYEKGLNDAWEAARKIHRMPDGDILDLFPDCYASVCTAAQAILKYDASEAIAKIKEYEDGKQEIKVGDEVERILDGEVDSKAVFLEENNGYYHCLFWTGSFFTTLSYPKKQFRKTGKHFPEIAAVLEKMRGEQE